MKKVVICIPSLDAGGAERFVVDLVSRVNKEKYEVFVAVTRNMTDSFLKKVLIERNIEIVDLSAKNYFQMTMKQLAFLKEKKPDVIHANIGSMLHMMVACKLYKVPTRLYTVHNEAKLLFGSNRIKKGIYKLAFSFFKFVPIAICPTVKETIEKEFGISSKKIPIVKNGVDIEKFIPCKEENANERIKIITVGTLYWIKNQELAIKAVCNLHKKGLNVSLEIVGDGADKEKLHRLIVDNKAESYITLHGKKKNVEDYLKKADVYISTSKTEGLPLSILEAMACGLPIVATEVGGVVDIVQNFVNGYLICAENIAGIEDALENLVLSKEKRREYGNESRRIAKEWSLDVCVREYEKLYERNWG